MSENFGEQYFRDGVPYIKTRYGKEFRMNTDEEDARIHAAALADPDAQPLTDEELAAMRPAHALPPEAFKMLCRLGIVSDTHAQFRLDDDLDSAFRATGQGWQARVNAALRMYLKEHPIPEPETVEAHP
jgi:uncharacterized protein (DUF4415 family)